MARRIYRNGHRFLEAFGAENGDKYAALDIIKLREDNFVDYYGSRSMYRGGALYNKDEKACKKIYRAELKKLLHAE